MKERESPDDLILIQRILGGEKESFGILIEKYKSQIYSLAYRMMGNKFDAEDVAQEAFLRAYRKLGDFKVGFKFFVWFYTITLNVARTALKKKGRIRIFSIDGYYNDEGRHVPLQIPDKKSGPEESVINHQGREEIFKMLDVLPEKYRTPLVLRYFEERSYEEISRLMGLPLGTIKIRIHRARNLLYKKWGKRKK